MINFQTLSRSSRGRAVDLGEDDFMCEERAIRLRVLRSMGLVSSRSMSCSCEVKSFWHEKNEWRAHDLMLRFKFNFVPWFSSGGLVLAEHVVIMQ